MDGRPLGVLGDAGPYAPWVGPLVAGDRETAADLARAAPEPPADHLRELRWALVAETAVRLGDAGLARRARHALRASRTSSFGAPVRHSVQPMRPSVGPPHASEPPTRTISTDRSVSARTAPLPSSARSPTGFVVPKTVKVHVSPSRAGVDSSSDASGPVGSGGPQTSSAPSRS